ncbi:hypothetical protein GWK08_02000 [Leptobacterium flavescens]|uniref:DUF4097 family beta strand repeat protein n=1 Tax=Leptobacterium flavescens TaxID=472055 RepID=A0A6P0UMD7_9FLAO|nr:ATP synthase F0 subunit B [Leptobacterium flavescens]NER12203.1 hypothetical protein [Leptobacterium flavescens]
MKHLKTKQFSCFWIAVLSVVFAAIGQTQTKRYTENFKINGDAVIEINTSHTDIEFETWDRNEVAVEAIIEIEGVSKEEAQKYFENWDFEAVGNSSKVSISTKSGFNFRGLNIDTDFVFPQNFKIEIPDIDFEFPEINDIEFAPMVLELSEIPPLPPIPFHSFKSFNFDYEAYKKDGDAYLKKWRKEFNKEFDGEFKKELEEWKKEIEKYKGEREKRKVELKKRLEERKTELAKVKKDRKRHIEEARKKAAEAREKVKEQLKKANVYYFSGDEDKNIKIKKTIKIKMPKSAKLKMDVRHGEVKLAQNLKNIKATLSHTRLLADNIDGEYTDIEASYSPVIVQNWNYGRLKVNFVKEVELKNVKSLKLTSNSSDVYIGTIIDNSIINGSFGKLEVSKIGEGFSSLDVSLENTDARLVLPKTAYSFYCNGANSDIVYPEFLVVKVTDDYSNKLIKGYSKSKNADKSIYINAKYSDIVMQ